MNLDTAQRLQEEQYAFPYHFLDLVDDYRRLIYQVPDQARRDLVKSYFEPFTGQRILDAGCGDGRFCYDLRDVGAQVFGCDYSESAIRFARAFCPLAEFSVQDLAAPDYEFKFRNIALIETLEHIPVGDVDCVVKGLAGILESDGVLVITVPSTNVPVLRKHYQHFSPESLRSVLEPHFGSLEIGGIGRLREKMSTRHRLTRRFAKWAFPFRKRSKIARSAIDKFRQSHYEHCQRVEPAEASGLYAVCRL